jgi:hypothetical protein
VTADTKPARHSWDQEDQRHKSCAKCGIRALARPHTCEWRWYQEYTKPDGQCFVANRVPPCEPAVPAPEPARESAREPEPGVPHVTPEESRPHATELDRAAGFAWRVGDLDRAARPIADCMALDPDLEELWRQRREQLAASARTADQTLEEQLRQRLYAAGNSPDDAAFARIREWNAAVFAREAGQ